MLNTIEKGEIHETTILDSSLISPTILETKATTYDIKMVECGDYIQIYFFHNKKVKKITDKDIDKKLKKVSIDNLCDLSNDKNTDLHTIELKNAIRSKIECQRLAKSNHKEWKTFITLTFEENVTDIEVGNKEFRYFVDKVRRIKKGFKYIVVPEFQKRGAIHYHLLTNIDIDDNILIYSQEDNEKYKHIKYWQKGFTKVDKVKGDIKKIIGYISKYMTKDIDNKLFGKHRYMYSQNLVKPKDNYINLDNEFEKNYYTKKIQDKSLIYTNDYINPYDNSIITFLEFLK